MQRLPPLQATKRESGLSQFAVAEVFVAGVARMTGLGCATVVPASSLDHPENLTALRALG